MAIVAVVVLFWVALAGYVALSVDGVLRQNPVVAYLHNVPFMTMPTTNGLLLGFLTIGLIFFTLAALPVHHHVAGDR